MNQTTPTLADAREAARQLGGEAASVVIRYLDALAAPVPDLPSPPPSAAGPAAPPAAPPAQLEQKLPRPPLGLRPLEFAVIERRTELLEAIHRYRQAGYTVPEHWEHELGVVHWLVALLRRPRGSALFF